MARFHELENSLHTREGSTTLIATVASSASIVLLASFPFPSFPQFIVATGVVVPIVGEAYRELTIMGIDALDLADLGSFVESANLLRDRVRADPKLSKRFRTFHGARGGAIRVLLLAPSFTWIYAYWRARVGTTNLESTLIFALLLAVILLIAVGFLNWLENERKEKARCVAKQLRTSAPQKLDEANHSKEVDNKDNSKCKPRSVWYDKELVLLGVLAGVVAQFLYDFFQGVISYYWTLLTKDFVQFFALLLALVVVLFGYGLARAISPSVPKTDSSHPTEVNNERSPPSSWRSRRENRSSN